MLKRVVRWRERNIMAWIIRNRLVFCLLLVGCLRIATGLECGYPGSPAFGQPVPVRSSYRPGWAVRFSCVVGHTLLGNLERVCLENGTWSGKTPICDRSLPRLEQHASSRATLEMYDAQNAIDGRKETCTYTDKKRPRWVRVDLRRPYTIQAVSVTVPRAAYHVDTAQFTIFVISVQDATKASYHKCADFNGKFPTPTVKLPCGEGGVHGSYVHIEDKRKNIDYFGVCEIEVYVQKDSYECGEADRPSNSFTNSSSPGLVEYRCMHGYKLLGSATRHCLPNGQWSGMQPLCSEVVCPLLNEVPNGTIHYMGPTRGRARLDTVANVTCDFGYHTSGQSLRCLESGKWSSDQPSCQPMDCGNPSVRGGEFVLLNGSTTYGNMAFVFCNDNSLRESPTLIFCREDATWVPNTDCSQKNTISTLGLVEEEENTIPNGVIIGMAVVVLLLLVVLIFILFFRRKQLMRRSSDESLPSKDTSSSVISKEAGNPQSSDNDGFYASIGVENNGHQKETAVGNDDASVEKGILSTILFAKRKLRKGKLRKKAESDRNAKGGSSEQAAPVYAQVDLDEKRRSRLAKSLTEQLDCAAAAPDHTRPNDRALDLDSELDSEPIKLRELPPIPDDDKYSETYASLSSPPEPPPPSLSMMRDNEIYFSERPYDRPMNSRGPIMKDNDLYTIT